MKELFRPAMALMNRLKYPHKFALISLLFAFPLALVLYFLISQINTDINVAQKEIYGTAYLRPLRQLLEHVPQHGLLVHDYLEGDVTVREDLLHKQAEIEADFQALQAADQRVGTWLDTTDKLRTRSAHWQSLKEEIPRLQPAESAALHTRLIADIRALMSHVGDTSNLILDPDLDSY